ncbi:hypothetical protein [Rubritalea sp.]|uniref:hypothetical protein n=1 Tax=Rubritalea sp. TaxID=2109375 RepID=UPI003EF786A8
MQPVHAPTSASSTDLKLLGEAREKTEDIVDSLHAASIGERKAHTHSIKSKSL